jgi:hypothetical protein
MSHLKLTELKKILTTYKNDNCFTLGRKSKSELLALARKHTPNEIKKSLPKKKAKKVSKVVKPKVIKPKEFKHTFKKGLLVPDATDEKIIKKYIKKRTGESEGDEDYDDNYLTILRFVSAGIKAKPKKADGTNLFTKRNSVKFLLFKK